MQAKSTVCKPCHSEKSFKEDVCYTIGCPLKLSQFLPSHFDSRLNGFWEACESESLKVMWVCKRSKWHFKITWSGQGHVDTVWRTGDVLMMSWDWKSCLSSEWNTVSREHFRCSGRLEYIGGESLCVEVKTVDKIFYSVQSITSPFTRFLKEELERNVANKF